MFRASEVGSEETLPLIGALTQNELNALNESDDNRLKQCFGPRRRSMPSYGMTTLGSKPSAQYKYPLAVYFVLATKFFEAFAANGIRTVLALYLRDDLAFSESFATIMLHIFNFFGQFCPIIGAIIADSYLGNVRTISAFCFLYALGWLLLIINTMPDPEVSLVLLVSVALLFIAIGNGSIRACITSLGAIQFKLPEQTKQLADYFFFYYLVYYSGIFLSKILPPFVRANTKCFDKNNCYAAVFGTLGGAFAMSWLVFTTGKCFYKAEKLADDNILLKFYGCIKTALLEKWHRRGTHKRTKYWLHNAIGSYEETFVNDVSKVLRISKLFIPLPIYFALLAQQDSSWTFQATQMNTTILGVTIQPDQAKAMGPIFLFILIPLWQYLCIPTLKNVFNFQLKPLHSVTIGGVCSALSFICAGILQERLRVLPLQSIGILWQAPQFILLMLGELLLSIPGLQFAFTQAPQTMKSVVTAAWFLNNAFGNLIVVFITEIDMLSSPTAEYFFYAVLMLVSIIIFTLLAYDYVLHERSGGFYARKVVVLPPTSDEREPLVAAASSCYAKPIFTSITEDLDDIPSTSRSASV